MARKRRARSFLTCLNLRVNLNSYEVCVSVKRCRESREEANVNPFSESNVFIVFKAGISAAPARAVSAMKSMNLPQQIKDMKLPDLPTISSLKF